MPASRKQIKVLFLCCWVCSRCACCGGSAWNEHSSSLHYVL